MTNIKPSSLTNSEIRNKWKLRLIDADLSIQTKMVAVVIEARLDHKTLTCFPSYQSLMSNCKISRPTLMKSLKKLEEDGWITRCRRFSKTTIYSIGQYEAPILIEDDQVVEEIGKYEAPIIDEIEGIGKHEAPIIDEIEGIGKHEAPMIGQYEAPLTLSSNLLLIDPSKEIYTGVKVDEDVEVIIPKSQIIDFANGMHWLKNGDMISEADVEVVYGIGLKIIRMPEGLNLAEH